LNYARLLKVVTFATAFQVELLKRQVMLNRVRALFKRILKTIVRVLPGNELRIFLLRLCGYKIGDRVRIGEDLQIAELLDSFHEKLVIGDRVAIANGVTLVIGSSPSYSRIRSIFPSHEGKIHIEDDAWIGAGAIIMPDVTIGTGAVVGSGAVVIKDVEPFTVVVGVPARPIKRFSLETGEVIELPREWG
jgi:acetyltransferase-like isoleucine patch superfamily enzyme